MSSDIPDWLSELMPGSEEEQPQEAAPEDAGPMPLHTDAKASRRPRPQEAAPEDMGPMPLHTDAKASRRPRPQEAAPEDVDLMVDLRSQVVTPEVAPPPAAKKARSRYVVGGLLSWQLFFLSVLLFLDVAIVGMLFLVMLERVVLP